MGNRNADGRVTRKKLVILTGAGISAESGLRTFRDSDGLWEGYDILEVASPHGWKKDPKTVLDFYNMRRRDVARAQPNAAHYGLAALEKDFDVHIITQNIDDLHERAGSTKITHLHGEIFKMRSVKDERRVYEIREDIQWGDTAPDGGQYRPHIVWFDEPVPMIEEAIKITRTAELFVVVGTSLAVYPAAGLVNYAPWEIPKFIIDKQIPDTQSLYNLTAIEATASEGVELLKNKVLLFLFIFLFLSMHGFSQLSDACKELKAFVKNQPSLSADSAPYLSIYHQNELNYLYPFYKAFSKEQQLIRSQGISGFYDDLSQAAAFIGDYSSVLELEKASYEPIPDSVKQLIGAQTDIAKTATYADAQRYILNRARSAKVIMINEAHDKPLHRVFTASLLEELYQQGYHYLALESLNPYKNASLTKLNMFTGHYTCEPIAGELVRKALELGFTLVPYEDTLYQHTPNQRAYQQAANLYAVLRKDITAKILVQAGYGQTEKGARSDSAIPLAAYFRIISGMDPLTIDQVEMSERSNSAYGSLVYESWMKKHPANTASVPLINDHPVDPFDLNLSDIYVIHPPTNFSNGRPVWTTMNGWKKETAVPPAYKSLFLVQAYYDKEYNKKTAGQTVPADQTYNTATNGYYYLYLRKGKYKIVFRDKSYKILGTRDIETH